MATVASLFRDAVQVTPAAEQVDALPAASMVALPDELLRHIFRQACSVLEPRCAVALSSASHGLWALTQEGRQQLKADHEAATAAAEVNCTICNQRWPSLLMLQHMGYHQLHTPEKMVSTNSCGFCGGDAALCRSWLNRGGGATIKALTKCVLLGGVAGKKPLNYNHASAKKMSALKPCTNHLVECAHCEPEQNQKRPCFWSYNLAAHHTKEHPSHPLPAAATISALERELVKVVGIKKGEKLSSVQKAQLKAASGVQPAAD